MFRRSAAADGWACLCNCEHATPYPCASGLPPDRCHERGPSRRSAHRACQAGMISRPPTRDRTGFCRRPGCTWRSLGAACLQLRLFLGVACPVRPLNFHGSNELRRAVDGLRAGARINVFELVFVLVLWIASMESGFLPEQSVKEPHLGLPLLRVIRGIPVSGPYSTPPNRPMLQRQSCPWQIANSPGIPRVFSFLLPSGYARPRDPFHPSHHDRRPTLGSGRHPFCGRRVRSCQATTPDPQSFAALVPQAKAPCGDIDLLDGCVHNG